MKSLIARNYNNNRHIKFTFIIKIKLKKLIDEYKKYLRDCFQNFHDYFENIVSFILQERKIWLVIMEWSLKIGNNLGKPGE